MSGRSKEEGGGAGAGGGAIESKKNSNSNLIELPGSNYQMNHFLLLFQILFN